MKKKKEHHEEHVDETWLIPYADMLTLLLALFIVMFAMSKVDSQKLQRLSAEFNVIFSGGSSVMAEGGTDTTAAVQSQAANAGKSTTEKSETQKEQDKMSEIKQSLESEIQSKGYADKVKLELNGEGLEISIQDAVLFNSGDASVLQNINPLLLEISKMIKGLDNEIRVAGHTDNVPISTSKFRSNWDLSAMRAINVMNFMVNSGGVNANKISIQAYGEFKPKYSNDTAEGRAKNRRVEIFIIRKYSTTTASGTTTQQNTTTENKK